MKKGLTIAIVLALITVQFISAYSTEVRIRTVPKYEVQVSFMDRSGGGAQLLQAFKKNANAETGEASFIFTSEKSTFDLIIFIKSNGETVIQDKRIDLVAGNPIQIDMAPKWFNLSSLDKKKEVANVTPIVNETVIEVKNETVVIPEVKKEDTSSTGYAVSSENSIFSRDMIIYGVGGFILAGAVFGGLFRRRLNKKKKQQDEFGDETTYEPKNEIVVRKLSEVRKSDAQKLLEAERKIQEAQEEITKIKNTDRIKQQRIQDARRKLIADEQELMKLRKGEN